MGVPARPPLPPPTIATPVAVAVETRAPGGGGGISAENVMPERPDAAPGVLIAIRCATLFWVSRTYRYPATGSSISTTVTVDGPGVAIGLPKSGRSVRVRPLE